MATVTGGPAATVRDAFAMLDKGDLKGFTELATEDGQGVDEISRRWLRGHQDLSTYMSQLEGAVKDVRSELKDVHETIMGEVSVATCWLEQDYTMERIRLRRSRGASSRCADGRNGSPCAFWRLSPQADQLARPGEWS